MEALVLNLKSSFLHLRLQDRLRHKIVNCEDYSPSLGAVQLSGGFVGRMRANILPVFSFKLFDVF